MAWDKFNLAFYAGLLATHAGGEGHPWLMAGWIVVAVVYAINWVAVIGNR